MPSIPLSSLSNQDLDSTLRENRVFPPPEEFSAKAHIKSLEEYETLYKHSIEDPETFWAGAAKELHWFKPWDKVLEWNLPWAKWFVGGKINLSYNCVDRHALGLRASKTALIWEGEPGEIRRLTYLELHGEVQKFANALKSLGIKKGDRVAIYMGMTPELAIALLACARIGAVHSVIFGGFAATAIADRVNDSGCVAILTQDSSYGVAAKFNLNVQSTKPCRAAPPSSTSSSTSAPVPPSLWLKAATTGGTIWSPTRPPNVPRNHSIRKTRSTSFTPPAPPANPRDWSTRREGIPSAPISPPNMSSICATTISIGARRTSDGLQATPMLCMDHCRTALRF
jgi:hypothetical protein